MSNFNRFLNLLRQVPRAVQYHRDASPLKRCSKTKKLFLSLINVGNVQRRYIEVQINGVWCIIDIYMVKYMNKIIFLPVRYMYHQAGTITHS